MYDHVSMMCYKCDFGSKTHYPLIPITFLVLFHESLNIGLSSNQGHQNGFGEQRNKCMCSWGTKEQRRKFKVDRETKKFSEQRILEIQILIIWNRGTKQLITEEQRNRCLKSLSL